MWLPAFLVPARVAADDWTRHLVARLGASVLAGVAILAAPAAIAAVARWTDAGCLVRSVAGVPCPGCGITTSLLALGRGHLADAWTANPAGLAVAGLLLGQAVVAAGMLHAGGVPTAGLARLSWLDRAALAALLTVWAWRLAGTS